ncbi:hypothetical protein BDR22DRAFT_846565 [Usnea florida]
MPLWWCFCCLESCGLPVRAFFAIDCYWPQNTDLLLLFKDWMIKQDDLYGAPIVPRCYMMNGASGFRCDCYSFARIRYAGAGGHEQSIIGTGGADGDGSR